MDKSPRFASHPQLVHLIWIWNYIYIHFWKKFYFTISDSWGQGFLWGQGFIEDVVNKIWKYDKSKNQTKNIFARAFGTVVARLFYCLEWNQMSDGAGRHYTRNPLTSTFLRQHKHTLSEKKSSSPSENPGYALRAWLYQNCVRQIRKTRNQVFHFFGASKHRGVPRIFWRGRGQAWNF